MAKFLKWTAIILVGGLIFFALVFWGYILWDQRKQEERKSQELQYQTGGKVWRWHDEYGRVQVSENKKGKPILRKVNLSGNYTLSLAKFLTDSGEARYHLKVDFYQECTPKTVIEAELWTLRCSEDGNNLWSGITTPNRIQTFDKNVHGFKFRFYEYDWDFDFLDREYAKRYAKMPSETN